MNNAGMLDVLRDTIVTLVRREAPDLSARQLGVFLTCYLRDDPHTVRGLSDELKVPKPAISRALVPLHRGFDRLKLKMPTRQNLDFHREHHGNAAQDACDR